MTCWPPSWMRGSPICTRPVHRVQPDSGEVGAGTTGPDSRRTAPAADAAQRCLPAGVEAAMKRARCALVPSAWVGECAELLFRAGFVGLLSVAVLTGCFSSSPDKRCAKPKEYQKSTSLPDLKIPDGSGSARALLDHDHSACPGCGSGWRDQRLPGPPAGILSQRECPPTESRYIEALAATG